MNTIDMIKSRITVEDILSEQGFELTRGRCRCPLHGGDNPTSFSVRDGLFHCFACGEGGDVVSLVQNFYRLDFKEALRYLAQKAGIANVDYCKPAPQKTEGQKRDRNKHPKKKPNDTLDRSIKRWTRVLRTLEKDLKDRKIDLPEYYRKQQEAEYELSRLDELSIMRNYERNVRRKERWKKRC